LRPISMDSMMIARMASRLTETTQYLSKYIMIHGTCPIGPRVITSSDGVVISGGRGCCDLDMTPMTAEYTAANMIAESRPRSPRLF